MIRSVCLISREFPPETSFGGIARLADMQANALAELGLSVHVLTLGTGAGSPSQLRNGFVVHRVAAPSLASLPDAPYVGFGSWAMTVARAYADLDARVSFDAVLAPDYHAESLHLERRPETVLGVYLHAPSRVVSLRSGRATTPGEHAAEALEGAALQRADVLLAPTRVVLDATLEAFGRSVPPAVLCPPLFDASRFAGRPPLRPSRDSVEVVFVGRLEPLKRPDLALRAVAAARARGLDARLTLVGRDVCAADGSSYRRGTLLPLLRELGLDFGAVRFVDQVDEKGVLQHLRSADVAVLPSEFENVHMAALEALAAGVPVITSDRSGLADWLGRDDGLLPLPIDNAVRFADAAAAALADGPWLERARSVAPERVSTLFDPAASMRQTLEALAEARPAATPEPARPPAGGPSLAIVVLAHNALAYTMRCLRSVLTHTDTSFRVYLVDNASTDGTSAWAATLEDDRVVHVRSDENVGVSGGRNLGLAAAADDGFDYVVFLDNDVEVLAGWWRRFVDALESDPEAGIAGERGVVLRFHEHGRHERALDGATVQRADMVVGYCMVMRASVVEHVGRFDENLGLFWHDDDDYSLRAARLGYGILHVGSGLVHHYEHKSSETVAGIWAAPEVPSEMSQRNQRYIGEKWGEGVSRLTGSRSVAFLALADEIAETPGLVAAYADAFEIGDDATLVVYAPGWSDERLATLLEPLLPEDAPDVLGLAVVDDYNAELLVARSVDAVLTERLPAGAWHALPHAGAARVEVLAEIARRLWERVPVAG